MKCMVKISKTLVAAVLLSMALVGNGWAAQPAQPTAVAKAMTPQAFKDNAEAIKTKFAPLVEIVIENNYSGRVISMEKRKKVVSQNELLTALINSIDTSKPFPTLISSSTTQGVLLSEYGNELLKLTEFFRDQIANEAIQNLESYKRLDGKIQGYKSDFLKKIVSFFVFIFQPSSSKIAQSILDWHRLDAILLSANPKVKKPQEIPSYASLPEAIQQCLVNLHKKNPDAFPDALSTRIKIKEKEEQEKRGERF